MSSVLCNVYLEICYVSGAHLACERLIELNTFKGVMILYQYFFVW